MMDDIFWRISLLNKYSAVASDIEERITPKGVVVKFGPGESPAEKIISNLDTASLAAMGGTFLLSRWMPVGNKKNKIEGIKEYEETLRRIGGTPQEKARFLKETKPTGRIGSWFRKLRGKQPLTGEEVAREIIEKRPQKAISKTMSYISAQQMGLSKPIQTLEHVMAKKPAKILTGIGQKAGMGAFALSLVPQQLTEKFIDPDVTRKLQDIGFATWGLSSLPQSIIEGAKGMKAAQAAYRAAGGGLRGVKSAFAHGGKILSVPWYAAWATGGLYSIAKDFMEKKKKYGEINVEKYLKKQ